MKITCLSVFWYAHYLLPQEVLLHHIPAQKKLVFPIGLKEGAEGGMSSARAG
jgi:hypothetical protein